MIEIGLTNSWYSRPAELGIWLNTLIAEGARVLEIGPGHTPFFRSTHFIDAYWDQGYAVSGMVPGAAYVACNVDVEEIPFPDKYFDFVFSSHVLEDLCYPVRVCKEMSRVGKAGFSTTPSPIAEFCRGPQSVWRGHQHHNWFVYASGGTLHFLKKSVMIEHINFPNEAAIEGIILQNDFLAHTYYPWEGEMNAVEDVSWMEGDVVRKYAACVEQSISDGINGTKQFLVRLLSETGAA